MATNGTQPTDDGSEELDRSGFTNNLTLQTTEVERGDTTTKTRYRGGFHLDVITEFEIPEGRFQMQLTMAEFGDHPHVHHHRSFITPGPCGHYKFEHDYAIDGVEAARKEREGEE